MAREPLHLTVLTPVETLVEAADVQSVQVQLTDGGGIGIYPGHAPLLAETIAAPLRYTDDAGEHSVDLEAGILQVDQTGVTLLIGHQTRPASTGGTAQASEQARFDRLARKLVVELKTQFEDILDLGDEDRDAD
ncbi:MAG TPA: hypothetical protein ENN99_00840 [Chloroflexi bacterium]|nr:hypothetical protein [Chloroflexota bacterium]